MRKIPFANEEIYHIYNRGTDKRVIFQDQYDFQRFLQSLKEFNTLDPVGGLYAKSFIKNNTELRHPMSKFKNNQLVEIIAYCLNSNHYHLLLRQVADDGISKFMQRLGNGYTKYFNHKNKRSGALFQGKFKTVHVDSNEYLLHLSVYVNLNYLVHTLRHPMSKSSFDEYLGNLKSEKEGLCEKEVILGQFKDVQEYQLFAKNTLEGIQERKILAQEKF